MQDIHITIYCDEVKKQSIYDSYFKTSENWDYIGVLIVPTSKIEEVSNELNSLRCPNNDYNSCTKNCEYHKENKIKIHYQKYSDTNNYQIADRWCNVYLNNNKNNKRFYAHILGINTVNIDKSFFKGNGQKTNIENNIYNRFFRTALKYPLKAFFSEYDEIIIDNIFHDSGNMDYHPYFKKNPIKKIEEEIENVHCICDEITILNTTNENCMDKDNVMLQFIDLFLGAALNSLHYIAKKNKEKIARKMLPIIKRIINEPNNKNGSYYKIYSISFFPKNRIDKNDDIIERYIKMQDNFYNNREIKMCKDGQLSLF